jgi:S-adenosylmethionine-diacylglycerol 3-amino-3-carboxypropyl transferase
VKSKSRDLEKWILYSTCDEDSRSELEALDIQRNDTVLSVTGSGCRTLSLMTLNPRRVTSVDYSAGQNYLLELKLVAIRELQYEQLLRFLGVHPSDDRAQVYGSLRDLLTADAKAYFDRFSDRIKAGILYAGRHEQFYVRLVAPLVKALYGKHMSAIFSCGDIESQWEIYTKHIRGPIWRLLIKRGFSLPLIKLILNDAQYHIEVNVGSPGSYMLSRFEHTFRNHLARDNDWLSMMLRGKYYDSLPHFLLPSSVDQIKKCTSKLEMVTTNIIDYVKALPDRSVNKFSLSDVTSCISRQEFSELLSQVARVGVEHGRICVRNFLANHVIPISLSGLLPKDEIISQRLERTDRAFAYSFEVATIKAAA